MGAPNHQRWAAEQARAELRVRRWLRIEATGWCVASFVTGLAFGFVCMAVGT